MRGWRSYVEGAPNEVTSVCVTITFPANPELPEAIHDRPVHRSSAASTPATSRRAWRRCSRCASSARRCSTCPARRRSSGCRPGFDPLFPRDTLRAYWKSQYLDELSDEAIDTIAAKAAGPPGAADAREHLPHGRRDRATSARRTRRSRPATSPYMVSIDGMWTEAGDDDANVAWVRSAWERRRASTAPVRSTSTSPAWPTRTRPPAWTAHSGRNLARLAEIKAKYDPDNFFRINNNVVPAS